MQYKQPAEAHVHAHAPAQCPNCEAPLAADAHFCVQCGQNAQLHRLSIGHIFHDGIHYFLHADKSIFSLVKRLSTETGTVAREFIQGKRKRHFPPLNFFLIVAGLTVFSISIFKPMQKENEKNQQQMQALIAQIQDPVKKAMVVNMAKRQQNVSAITSKYSNILMMLALPLLSLIFYLCYRRGPYNYAEHVVASLYGVGFTSLAMSLVFTPLMSQFGMRGYFIVLIVYFVFEVTYRSVYYVKLFNKQGAAAYVKSALVALLAILVWMVITVSLIFWYMFSGMSGLFT
jgi:hypothetical protein